MQPIQCAFTRYTAGANLWQQCGNLFFLGKAFYKKSPLDLSLLEQDLHNCESSSEVAEVLNKLNGCFSLVLKSKGLSIAAVDIIRSYPLFYQVFSTECVIYDENSNIALDEEGMEKIESTWPSMEFLLGNDTATDKKSLQSGQFLYQKYDDKPLLLNFYEHQLAPGDEDFPYYKKEFEQVLESMQERLSLMLKGKTAVVPLSGGFDSRFILAMLKKAEHESIQAFTYGRIDGPEKEVAEQVAHELDIPWRFIEYNEDTLSQVKESQFLEYFHYASNSISIAQEQEYFAMKELVNNLPDDAVFLPGFCGDVQAGSFIPDKFYEKRWRKNPIAAAEFCATTLARFTETPGFFSDSMKEVAENFETFYGQVENWLLTERESKYVINALRCYEFFGYNWHLPLWDKEFIDFWKGIPLKFRRDKRLYVEVLHEQYFDPLGIDFKPKGFDQHFKSDNLASQMRYILPESLKTGLKKLLIPEQEREVNNLNMLEEILLGTSEDLPVNEVLARWFLQKLEVEREGE